MHHIQHKKLNIYNIRKSQQFWQDSINIIDLPYPIGNTAQTSLPHYKHSKQ